MSDHDAVTELLDAASTGNVAAANELFELVYQELRQMAGKQMSDQPSGLTLQSTAIVHEVWLRLVGKEASQSWNNRGHFFSAAAKAMRHILVDAARFRSRAKRGNGNPQVELRDDDWSIKQDEDLLALDESIDLLRAEHERKAELVQLRFYAGMTNSQAAQVLEISDATAERDWAYARAWLRSQMEDE